MACYIRCSLLCDTCVIIPLNKWGFYKGEMSYRWIINCSTLLASTLRRGRGEARRETNPSPTAAAQWGALWRPARRTSAGGDGRPGATSVRGARTCHGGHRGNVIKTAAGEPRGWPISRTPSGGSTPGRRSCKASVWTAWGCWKRLTRRHFAKDRERGRAAISETRVGTLGWWPQNRQCSSHDGLVYCASYLIVLRLLW